MAVGAGQGADGLGHFVEGAGKDGLLLVELATHGRVLGALTREEPDQGALGGCRCMDVVGGAVVFQRGDGVVECAGEHALAMRQRTAAVGQCEGDVVQVGKCRRQERVCVLAGACGALVCRIVSRIRPGLRCLQPTQVLGQLATLGGQRRGCACTERQEGERCIGDVAGRGGSCLRGTGGRAACRGTQCQVGRRFLDDDVGVGAAHAEGADGRTSRGAGGGRPWRGLGGDPERALFQLQAGVGLPEVQGAGNEVVLQGHHRLDGGRSTSCDDRVADVALERAEHGKAGVLGFFAPGAGQGAHFHRVAHGGGGTVSLHDLDAAGRHAGVVQGGADDGMLAFHADRGEAGLVAAVVVDAHAADEGVDGVAVTAGVGQTLEQHHGGTVGEHRALGIGIEAAGETVRREHRAGFVAVAAVDRGGDGNAPGQRHPALTGAQRLHGLDDGHQRGGAGGVHRDGGPPQVQPVGRAGGDVVLLVVEHHLELAQGGDLVRVVLQVTLEVGGVVHAGEDADLTVAVARGLAALLKALPGQFQEDALLRVHQLGFAWADAEEGGIKARCVVEHAACRHVVGVAGEAGGQGGVQLLGPEMTDAVTAGDQVLPEFLDAGGAREAACHANDGDGALVLVRRGSDVRLADRGGMWDAAICAGGSLAVRMRSGMRGCLSLGLMGCVPGAGRSITRLQDVLQLGGRHAFRDARGKGRHRGSAEEVLDADGRSEGLLQGFQGLGGQQRRSPHLEEVVVGAQAPDGQDGFQQRDDALFEPALERRGQGLAVGTCLAIRARGRLGRARCAGYRLWCR